jgi:hypothetical protein
LESLKLISGGATSHTKIRIPWEEKEESEESNISPQDKHLMKNLDELTMDDNSGTESEGHEAEGPGPARALLEELRRGVVLKDRNAPRTGLDNALDILCNHSMLRATCERLSMLYKDGCVVSCTCCIDGWHAQPFSRPWAAVYMVEGFTSQF